LVAPDRLRFDFSHPEPLSADQLRTVEDWVNRWILEDLPVQTREGSLAEAQAAGALAFFGEKYGERVRMVEVPGASLELCGGTHCRRTGQIGSLRVVGETGIGSGIRRVEAVTGWGALAWARRDSEWLQQAAAVLGVRPEHAAARARALQELVARLEEQTAAERRGRLRAVATALADEAVTTGAWTVIVARVPESTPEMLREVTDLLREKVDVAVLGAESEGRAHLAVWVGTRAQATGLRAGSLAKRLAPLVGGGGGGRADLAQAGGRDPAGLSTALEEARRAIGAQALQDIRS
jgi:alanyl-tRNA synthetase